LQEFGNELFVTFYLFARIIFVAKIIFFVGFEQYNAARFFVAKEGNTFVSGFFEIAETNDITKGFCAVCTRRFRVKSVSDLY
jgi:hypothetical protein